MSGRTSPGARPGEAERELTLSVDRQMLCLLLFLVSTAPLEATVLDIQDQTAHPDRWLATAAIPHCDGCTPDPAAIALTRAPLTDAESGWLHGIMERGPIWARSIVALAQPFPHTTPPSSLVVWVGKGAADDAFNCGNDRICFDVEVLARVYGPFRGELMDRLFAHEYTHVLHKRWLAAHPQPTASPLDRALLDAAVEGLGNYRSLSPSWISPNGEINPVARATLDTLAPIFAERMAALAHADSSQERELIKGLSSGPFTQKWGAVTVALWLAEECRGNDRRLRRFVEQGSSGVLPLARRHLPPELAARLPR